MAEPKRIGDERDLASADSQGTPLPLLQRISMREILALQALFALVIFVESTILSYPIGLVVFPLIAAFWSASRLRRFQLVTFVNPFTVTILIAILTHFGYSIAQNEFAARGVFESTISAIVTGVACGGYSAFLAVLIVNGWKRGVATAARRLGFRGRVEEEETV